jgi:hypothetical protein
MADYREQVQKSLKLNEKKLADAIQAGRFSEHKEARIALDILDDLITYAVEDMNNDKPLSYENYLSRHGEVRGLRSFRRTLITKPAEIESLTEQVKAGREQIENLPRDTK